MSNPKDAFSSVEGLRVGDGTVGCRPKRASRRDERETPRPRRSSWLWRCQSFSHSIRQGISVNLLHTDVVSPKQYERFGSLEAFLRPYLTECLNPPWYPNGPLEKEAEVSSEKLCRNNLL